MSISDQDWQKEQQRVDRVMNVIEDRIAEHSQEMNETKEEIVDIRKNFWDDVTVNFENTDDIIETFASMRQQQHILSERERTHQQAQNQLTKLKRLKQSPYFGRIDFIENGERRGDQVYLGIASLIDEEGEDFLIYDWRAPVSSLYYDYPPGPAAYETPSGEVEGELTLKRQYMIRDGQIRNMFDTGVTIGDEMLQEVLGRHADAQMRSIVATIQKEQNRMIRDERSRLLTVQGAAGSGKTSAALQRVAYLLYRNRETLTADQIVLFSPNSMFNAYIATVLPELGEENMQQTTFNEYLEHRIGQTFDLEDTFSQMEYTLTAMQEPGYTARIAGIQYKASTGFMEAIEGYLEELGREGMLFKDIKFRGEVMIPAERVQEQFYSYEPSLPIPNRMKLVSDWLLKELAELMKEERSKQWVEDEIELLDNEQYLKAYHELSRKKSFTEKSFDDFNRERDALAEMVVKKRFKRLRGRVKELRFIDTPGVYRQLFAEPERVLRLAGTAGLPEQWAEICAQTVEWIDREELPYEDATPYLYLKERIEGFQTNTSIRHVFIDEAQDYSLFQFAFIKRLFPRSKMTVLGDLNQAIYAHATDNATFVSLPALFDAEESETFVFTQTYRSTRQIVEFTRGMIHGGETIQPFNRPGPLPTVTQVSDPQERRKQIIERIQELQNAGHNTIAVICKTVQESQEAYDSLHDALPLRLIVKGTTHFEAGALVIPSYLAKGMEFDAVILFDASDDTYSRESERKLFYTSCTRAMHELHLYVIGNKSPFLQSVGKDTYTDIQ